MAKRICRTADRFDPTGVPLPRCCVRRATPPLCTAVVHEISQRDKDAFIFGEGCAGLARRQTGRGHSLPPGPGRAAPPICSDLIYDRHRIAPPVRPDLIYDRHNQNTVAASVMILVSAPSGGFVSSLALSRSPHPESGVEVKSQ